MRNCARLRLLAATCLASGALLAAVPALAQTMTGSGAVRQRQRRHGGRRQRQCAGANSTAIGVGA